MVVWWSRLFCHSWSTCCLQRQSFQGSLEGCGACIVIISKHDHVLNQVEEYSYVVPILVQSHKIDHVSGTKYSALETDHVDRGGTTGDDEEESSGGSGWRIM